MSRLCLPIRTAGGPANRPGGKGDSFRDHLPAGRRVGAQGLVRQRHYGLIATIRPNLAPIESEHVHYRTDSGLGVIKHEISWFQST